MFEALVNLFQGWHVGGTSRAFLVMLVVVSDRNLPHKRGVITGSCS